MKTKVKICGITSVEDARASVEAGCDALGFIFYKKSPRYTSPEKAKKIIDNLPPTVTVVGVFVNSQERTIRRIARMCRLDILQFHGNESAEFCSRFKGFKIIKVFRVKEKLDVSAVSRYPVFAYLFDKYSQAKQGGTGKTFNWQLIRHLSGLKQPIFLSGGLSEKNVVQAIKLVKPQWVDASTCLEASPGMKDHDKVRRFVRAVKKL